jgi:thiamine-phosphate diphosphorylase
LLYLITNRKLVANGDFYNIINEAIGGGIAAIILREKDLSTKELLPIAVRIKEAVGNSKVKLIINSNIQVAKLVKAHGFHTSFHNFIEEKSVYNGIIGVSVHSLEEAVKAEKQGADYLLFGHIFETDCKKGVLPRGLEAIREIKRNVHIPVIALGGIKPDNIQLVRLAGADGAAIMSSIMQAQNPYAVIKDYIGSSIIV